MTSIRVAGHNQSKHCEYVDARATCGALDDGLWEEWLVITRAEKLAVDVVLFFLLLHEYFNFALTQGMSG